MFFKFMHAKYRISNRWIYHVVFLFFFSNGENLLHVEREIFFFVIRRFFTKSSTYTDVSTLASLVAKYTVVLCVTTHPKIINIFFIYIICWGHLKRLTKWTFIAHYEQKRSILSIHKRFICPAKIITNFVSGLNPKLPV